MVYMVISHHVIVLPTNENIVLGTVPNAFFLQMLLISLNSLECGIMRPDLLVCKPVSFSQKATSSSSFLISVKH